MNKRNNHILILMIIFSSILHIPSYAQNRETVIKKLSASYTSKAPLQFSTVYNLYKNNNSKTISESYKGTFYKNAANVVYMKINTTEFYFNSTFGAQISPSEKTILITKPSLDIQKNHDINKLLESYKKGYFKDEKSYWEIELLAKPFSGLPYHRIIIQIGKDYFLKKQIFYYSTGTNFSKDFSNPDINNPVLEIIYSKHARTNAPESVYNTDKYFTIQKGNIRLSNGYKGYEIIDRR